MYTPDTCVEQAPFCRREHPLGDPLPLCPTHARGAWYTDPQTPCAHAEQASTPTSSAGRSPQTHRTFHRATAGRAGQSTAPPEPPSCLPAPLLHTAPHRTCLGEGALERCQQKWDRSRARLSPGLSIVLLRWLRGPFSEVPAPAKSLPTLGVLGGEQVLSPWNRNNRVLPGASVRGQAARLSRAAGRGCWGRAVQPPNTGMSRPGVGLAQKVLIEPHARDLGGAPRASPAAPSQRCSRLRWGTPSTPAAPGRVTPSAARDLPPTTWNGAEQTSLFIGTPGACRSLGRAPPPLLPGSLAIPPVTDVPEVSTPAALHFCPRRPLAAA